MDPIASLHLPQHMLHHRTPLNENETVVPQYSPAWITHVAAGGAVRNGNILVDPS